MSVGLKTHEGRVCRECGQWFAFNRYEGVPHKRGWCGYDSRCRNCYRAYMNVYMKKYNQARRVTRRATA